MFSDDFKSLVFDCCDCKSDFNSLIGELCDYLTDIAPCDYRFYCKSGSFIVVDVPFEDINEYVSFFDGLVDCRYTHVRSLNGVCLLVSLDSLKESIE